jgi:hypothetical protein
MFEAMLGAKELLTIVGAFSEHGSKLFAIDSENATGVAA